MNGKAMSKARLTAGLVALMVFAGPAGAETVTISGTDKVVDTYLLKDSAARGGESLILTYFPTTGSRRGLIKFDLSEIPADAQIISATIYLWSDWKSTNNAAA